MNCSHCSEPIRGDDFIEITGHETTALCLDCADLYDALTETGAFDAEGCTENAFFTNGEIK